MSPAMVAGVFFTVTVTFPALVREIRIADTWAVRMAAWQRRRNYQDGIVR